MKFSFRKIQLHLLIIVISYSLYILIKHRTNYVSHSNEPKIGDHVKINNPSCKHFESIGTVQEIKSLKGDSGKTIIYKVENDGSTYCKGQLLNKTMDQLAPL